MVELIKYVPEKDLRRWRLAALINMINSLVLIIIIGVSIYHIYSLNPLFEKNLKIDYSELNEEEKEFAENIIKQIKPEFLKPQKTIIFRKEGIDCERCIGRNIGGNIEIEWWQREDYLKHLLCHELLHTWIIDEEVVVALTVENMEGKLPCFEDDRT